MLFNRFLSKDQQMIKIHAPYNSLQEPLLTNSTLSPIPWGNRDCHPSLLAFLLAQGLRRKLQCPFLQPWNRLLTSIH